MNYSSKNLIKLLKERGWRLDRIRGSHHVFYNSEDNKSVIVPVHGNRDLAKGTFFSILKDAGIEKEDL